MHPPVAVLAHAIDYAGLFPPASLPIRAAVQSFADYAQSPDGWALGRFVVAVSQAYELLAALPEVPGLPEPLPVAVVLDADPRTSRKALEALAARVLVGAVEGRVTQPAEIPRLAPSHQEQEVYAEVPLREAPAPFVSALADRGVFGKLRTGGVTADAFPAPDFLLEWLAALAHADVPFKCTAGLHHPVRGRYRLTYAPDSPLGTMYGYLNVMVAGAGLRAGWSDAEAREALLEDNPIAFSVRGDALAWRDRELNAGLIRTFRLRGMRGFGSCSFREPLDELAEVPVA